MYILGNTVSLLYVAGTHHLRSVNNRYQPWSNCKVRKDMGLRSMNPTEEGLASLHSVLFRKDPCLWRAAVLYYTVYKASQMSLKEVFKDLGQYVQDPNVRWDYCIRAKRGQTDTSRPGTYCLIFMPLFEEGKAYCFAAVILSLFWLVGSLVL